MHGESYCDLVDRRFIAWTWEDGRSAHYIAKRLGVNDSTVYRELKRGRVDRGRLERGSRAAYDPELAHKRFQESLRIRTRNAGRPRKKQD